MSLSLSLAGSGWSAEYHAFAASSIPGVVMNGVFSPEKREAEDFARRHHIPHFYNDMEYLLEYSSPDIVVVATPTFSHLSDVEYIAKRGVSIFLETPLSFTRGEAEKIAEISEREGIYLFPVASFLSDPSLKALEEKVKEGFFGPSPRFLSSWSFPSPFERWKRSGNDRGAAGALIEAGAEAFMALRSLFPSCGPISAEEVDGKIRAKYESGELKIEEGREGFSITVSGEGRTAIYSNGRLEILGESKGERVYPRQLSFLPHWYRDTVSALEKGIWSPSLLRNAVESASDGEKVLSYVGNNCHRL